jgi:PAS domain S-box-containing protein
MHTLSTLALVCDGGLGGILSSDYLPHRYCYRAEPGLVWTNVIADAAITVAYVAIFAALMWIASRLRRHAQLRGFLWIFIAFGTFILSCAVTHTMEVVTVWQPYYPLSAALKVLCAAISFPTAVLFVRAEPSIAAGVARFFDMLNEAERARQEAAASVRGQIEAIDRSQMMMELEMDGTVRHANDNYLRFFGYACEEIEGRPHAMFMHPDDRESAEHEELWSALRGGTARSGRCRRIDKRGREVWIDAAYNPVLDADGKPVKVVKFATDVSERMRFQNEWNDSEARLRAILDSVEDGIITMDAEGVIATFNPAASRMFEYPESEVVGRSVKLLVPEKDRARRSGAPGTENDKPKPARREIEGLTRSGRVFPIELTVTEMRVQGQKAFVGVLRDLTTRASEEKARRRNEAFLDNVGSVAGLGGWDIDLATEEVVWGPVTRRILGADASFQPTLEQALELYAPASRAELSAAIEKASIDGASWDVEASLTSVDGRHLWVRVVGTVEVENGTPARLVGVLQDITARVAERQALEDANTRTLIATESCGIGIWDWDLQTSTFNCDAQTYRTFGLEPAEALQPLAFWLNRVHQDDQASVKSGLQQCLDNIAPYNAEFRALWDDGSIHYIKNTGRLIRDEHGVAARMVGTNMDVTVPHLADQALRDQASLLDLSYDCIMVRELGGYIQFWSRGAEAMYGYTRAEAVGKTSHELLKTTFQQPLKDIEEILNENGYWEGELCHTTRAGVQVVADSRWVLKPAVTGSLRRVLETNRDVTERKQAEKNLRRYTEALVRSNKELDEFAYAASHDLKAPLRVIYNASKWLEEDLEPHLTPDTRENMTLMRRRVVRMEKLLDDLLEYSRIGRKMDRNVELLSGDRLIEDILALIAVREGFVVNFSAAFEAIEVTRMPLQQILVNLINNAIKHHDKKSGLINVSVRDLDSALEFSVEDDGPGIPAQFHEQVFKMFQTLKPRDQVEGSGMGLAMVRKYIATTGGSIRIESAEGEGCTFRFTWPRQQCLQGEAA